MKNEPYRKDGLETDQEAKTPQLPAEIPAPEQTDDQTMQFAGVYTLQKPVGFEGKEVKTLDYDLHALSGLQIRQCRQAASKETGGTSNRQMLDDDLLMVYTFIVSAGMPFEFADALGGADYMAIATVAQTFFAGAASAMVG